MTKNNSNPPGLYDYDQPKKVPVPDASGYPDTSPKTQTKPIRGTGAATKGKNYSKNSN